jgi:hypothetical protein
VAKMAKRSCCLKDNNFFLPFLPFTDLLYMGGLQEK